jgi:hypothetical protein
MLGLQDEQALTLFFFLVVDSAAAKSVIIAEMEPAYESNEGSDDDDGDREIVRPTKKRAAEVEAVPVAASLPKKKTTSKKVNQNASLPKKKTVSKKVNQTKVPKPGATTSSKPKKLPAKEVSCGLPDEPLDGGWPAGWVKRVFERASGATKGGHDRYWYSPLTSKKFRSMVEVKRYMVALRDCGGDEDMAWKWLKNKV